MPPRVEFTKETAALLLEMRARHPNLVLLLDSTSCCSNSNIIARENKPSWPVTWLSERDGVNIYISPTLEHSLKAERLVIDAIDFADDSLSLETNYGKRFIMSSVL